MVGPGTPAHTLNAGALSNKRRFSALLDVGFDALWSARQSPCVTVPKQAVRGQKSAPPATVRVYELVLGTFPQNIWKAVGFHYGYVCALEAEPEPSGNIAVPLRVLWTIRC